MAMTHLSFEQLWALNRTFGLVLRLSAAYYENPEVKQLVNSFCACQSVLDYALRKPTRPMIDNLLHQLNALGDSASDILRIIEEPDVLPPTVMVRPTLSPTPATPKKPP